MLPPRRPDAPPPERGFWELLPRRNFRRALFLIAALLAVLALKRAGGGSFRKLIESVAPPSASRGAAGTAGAGSDFRHIEVVPPPAAPGAATGGTHP